jgi:tetratricopeptide (TPR) repeat protein
MRTWRTVFPLCGLLLSHAAWALDPAVLKQAVDLINSGKADAAYELLEPHEISEAGDIDFDYQLARAALESDKPSKATFIYERILAVDPTFIGVRADMGRAYYQMGDYARAKIEFETVLATQNVPPDLRTQVEQYMRAVEARAQDKKTVVTGYAEFGLGSDNNIGSATGQSALTLPASGAYTPTPPTGVKTADSYSTLALGGEVNHQLSEQWGVYTGADYRIRDHGKHNDPNNWTLDGRLGVSYSSGAWLLRTGLTAGTYFYYGDHLRDSIGLSADWRMALSTSSQVTAGGSIVRAAYLPSASLSLASVTYTGSLGWLTALGDGATIFSLTGSGGYEDDTKSRDDGNRRFIGPRVLVQTSFNDQLGGYVTGGVTWSDYTRANSYYLKPRSETLHDLTVALTWTVSKGISLRPQLSYTKNYSNAQLYAYDKTDASLNLRLDY